MHSAYDCVHHSRVYRAVMLVRPQPARPRPRPVFIRIEWDITVVEVWLCIGALVAVW